MANKKADDDPAVTMASLMKEKGTKVVPFVPGSVVEGKVLTSSSSRIWVDIDGVAVGVIPERELSMLAGELKPGDPIVASVLVLEDVHGNIVMSLRRADRERITNELTSRFKDGQPMQVKVTDANKGGLLIQLGDFSGFLPVSQLASEHYPRVENANPDEIYARLKDLVNQTLNVKVINFDSQQGKLIFSEKAAGDILQEAKLAKISENDILEGVITGIVDFGIFVRLGDGPEALEGLVHISEIAWGRVSDIAALYVIGQTVKVLVVSTADNRVSLSMKRLLPDPWQEAARQYQIGDSVKGTVTRITPFGVFVKLNENIDGLVHISEIANERITDPGTILHMGETFPFKVISIDPTAHRLGLSYKRLNEDVTEEGEKAAKKSKKEKAAKADKADAAEVAPEAKAEEPAAEVTEAAPEVVAEVKPKAAPKKKAPAKKA